MRREFPENVRKVLAFAPRLNPHPAFGYPLPFAGRGDILRSGVFETCLQTAARFVSFAPLCGPLRPVEISCGLWIPHV